MKILLVHNFYQQPGGEDGVFAEEGRLLESRGHDVARFTLHNDAVPSMGKLSLAKKTIWNREAADALRLKIREHGSQIVHFHNTFMLISRRRSIAMGMSARTACTKRCPGRAWSTSVIAIRQWSVAWWLRCW